MVNELEMRHALARLNDERTRAYEVQLSDYAMANSTPAHVDAFLRIARDVDGEKDDVRYAAFYALSIIFRRLQDFQRLDDLMGEFSDDFSDHPTFAHLELLVRLDREDFSNPYGLLTTARDDARRFKRNAGYVHLYADLFATICESRVISNTEKFLDKWYEDALDAANRAIMLDGSYAKYYCTRARILVVGGRYDEAEKDIQHAISIEDSSRADYAVRLQRYHYYKLKFDSGREITALTERVERLEQAIEDLMAGRVGKPEREVPVPEAYDGLMPYVFLSYSHADAEEVHPLINALQERGARIWFDKGIEPGTSWEEEIVYRIEDSEAVLFCLSGKTKISQEVTKEISLASSAKKLKICVDLEQDCLATDQKYQLKALQHIHAYGLGKDEVVDAVFASIPDTAKGA